MGGTPSTTHPTPPPCDSPNVVTRNRRPKELPLARVVTERIEEVRQERGRSTGAVRERKEEDARGQRRWRSERTPRGRSRREKKPTTIALSALWRVDRPRAVPTTGRGALSPARGRRIKGASRSTSTRRRRGGTSEIRGVRTGSAAGDDARGARCRANRGGAVALARAEARGNGARRDDGRRDDHVRRDWDVRVTRKEDAGRVSRHKWLAAVDRSRFSRRSYVDVRLAPTRGFCRLDLQWARWTVGVDDVSDTFDERKRHGITTGKPKIGSYTVFAARVRVTARPSPPAA